jgi:hypothetical protein
MYNADFFWNAFIFRRRAEGAGVNNSEAPAVKVFAKIPCTPREARVSVITEGEERRCERSVARWNVGTIPSGRVTDDCQPAPFAAGIPPFAAGLSREKSAR